VTSKIRFYIEMACLLKPVANFADLESVRLLLFPDERKSSKLKTKTGSLKKQ
jgi:hypothetical protein